ncbi:MAG TPA: hypothetical protein VGQ99_00515 [Tepidisphaeraceae bacterium]|jgi:hypothetical protein|nr:hypothetical protein [Tepidisphaeraceae bacterium]
MKRFLIPLLFVAALTLLPNPAEARGYSRSRFDFTFGFSSGYYNRGYSSFHYGYSRPYYRDYCAPIYRSRYYYNDPVYIAPPVVYIDPAPVYIYPRRPYYYRDSYRSPRYYYSERSYYYER